MAIEGESYTLDVDGTPQYTELMTANPNGDTFKTCQLLYTMVMVPTVLDTSASFGLYNDAQLEARKSGPLTSTMPMFCQTSP